MVDAQYAERVVAVTDHLVPHPVCPIDIAQDQIDFVVQVDLASPTMDARGRSNRRTLP